MNKKTIGIIAISVVLGAFILVCVKEKVDDFNQNPTKQMWDLYKESEKISKTPLKDNSENIWKSLFLKRDCTYRVKGSLFTVIYRERYSSLKKEVYESMIVLRNGTDIYEVKKIVPKIHREFHVRYMVTKNSYDVNNILNVILGIEDLFSK